jgi:hypothetical protein
MKGYDAGSVAIRWSTTHNPIGNVAQAGRRPVDSRSQPPGCQ